MEPLINCFSFSKQQVVSLIGSGGKTSLMWYLADCFKKEKVLVSTTTKIGYPHKKNYDYFYKDHFAALGTEGCGITLAGTVTHQGQKLGMPELPDFPAVFSRFDKVLLEADGSKQLPLKGWETFEPVVLPQTTVTIGLIPISVIGETADRQTVHRLDLFLRAIERKAGHQIDEDTLAEIIASPTGLFEKSRGRRILCINQVETPKQLEQARKVLQLLPHMLLKRLSKVIACSIQSQKGVVLWEKQNNQ
ncbi:putative selenium-dependent hydroxylase accessory protein YqeC [Erwinia sp. CPCC 100877]|nr:putative selenium-dependent hydroxylase accessory protein YqeC [Erwinia sp. CPCC 100877]